MKFIQRPEVIDGVQYLGVKTDEMKAHLEEGAHTFTDRANRLVIEALEGEMRANVGDWVLKNESGCFCIMGPDDFERAYVKVENETSP